MKKYIAAAAVAVMVFAFAAMAASLTVNGGVIQAGSDDDLTCTEESLNVASYRINNNQNGVGSLGVRFASWNECEGADVDVFVHAYDIDGTLIARSFGNTDGSLVLDWANYPDGAWPQLATTGQRLVDPAQIEEIQVILESAG